MPISRKARDLLLDEAMAHYDAGMLEESLRLWERVRGLRDTPNSALRHGYVAFQLERWEDAERAALEGIRVDPANQRGEHGNLYCLAGQARLGRNRADGRKEHLENARSYFERAIEVEQRCDFYILLGTTYMRMNNDASAEQVLRRALELEPSNDEAMYNLAEVIRCSREEAAPPEAVELYRKSLAIDPNYAQAYRGLAYVFFASKQFEDAENYARRALKADGTDWAAHTVLGRLLLRRGKREAASKELQRGAELAPSNWEAQSTLAEFYDDNGPLKNALLAYRKCLDLDPDNAWANRRYGAVLAEMGRSIEARVFLKRALALNPADQFANQYLRKLDEFYPHRRVTPSRVPKRKRRE